MRVTSLAAGLFGLAVLVSAADAQINQFVGTPAGATNFLDFDSPLVPSGPISPTDPAFTSNGIASVNLFGTWTTAGDTMTASSNVMGQGLVSQLGGTLSVAGVGQPLDNASSGAGFDIVLQNPANEFGVLFVDQINFSYSIELFSGAASLGVGNFSYGMSSNFPFPPHYWSGPSSFDRIVITFLSTIGVGIDNFAFDVGSISTFCTAKTALVCGTPSISSSGSPSATAGSGFNVSAGPARSCKSGILLYNTSAGVGMPFQGGTLCVAASGLRRAGSTNSGGTPGANCDGVFTVDMNAFAVGAWVVPDCLGLPSGTPPNNPAPYLQTPGTMIFSQFWGRDSVATGSFVSDGLSWMIGP